MHENQLPPSHLSTVNFVTLHLTLYSKLNSFIITNTLYWLVKGNKYSIFSLLEIILDIAFIDVSLKMNSF